MCYICEGALILGKNRQRHKHQERDGFVKELQCICPPQDPTTVDKSLTSRLVYLKMKKKNIKGTATAARLLRQQTKPHAAATLKHLWWDVSLPFRQQLKLFTDNRCDCELQQDL